MCDERMTRIDPIADPTGRSSTSSRNGASTAVLDMTMLQPAPRLVIRHHPYFAGTAVEFPVWPPVPHRAQDLRPNHGTIERADR